MPLVALVRCEDYDYSHVKTAVEIGLELLGGPERFIQSGEKILLKPNLLAPAPPEECVTTHPSVFKAVGEILMVRGVRISYGDSPAMSSPINTARKSGIYQAGQELGIEMADFNEGIKVSFPEGKQHKSFILARGVVESDGIISIAKMKTHGLTRLTGAVKNQFGCIPGVLKGEFHAKLPELDDFATMLVDLNLLLKPRLYIMDGIIAMEGNGPRGGKPREMNVLMFSADPVALDATMCRMLGVKPDDVPTIRIGQKNGLGQYEEESVTLVGDPLRAFQVSDFSVARSGLASSIKSTRLRNIIVPRPDIKKDKCIRCGICVDMCPVDPKAVDWENNEKEKPPVYNYDLCIRCYCCQETCPEGAIEIVTPPLGRVLDRFKP
ncbi:iron-sulfur cluster-binding protein [hydrocarbon metagenome]|uniref:Iron-sulfur cluster-binding protein n=1 Tax=hydrocarbon metagenome TaxID=938273 RepID=A0A0W8E540_9ZZZZ